MELLTVLTPTYNRCDNLKEAFISLQKQTNLDFKWLIIDDGSSDETYVNVQKFIEISNFSITYIKQSNGGKHRALNVGIKLIETPLTMILDSDDILLNNAVQTIREKWFESKNDDIAYLSFLRLYKNGKVIGDKYPSDGMLSSHIKLCVNQGIKGDKCEVYRTDVLKQFPFPEIIGEKFLSEGVVWNRIGKKYNARYYNIGIYQTEYLRGGLTKSGMALRLKNPIGSLLYANECLTKEYSITVRIKHALLYSIYKASAIDNGSKLDIPKSNFPILTFIATPFGVLFYKFKSRKGL